MLECVFHHTPTMVNTADTFQADISDFLTYILQGCIEDNVLINEARARQWFLHSPPCTLSTVIDMLY